MPTIPSVVEFQALVAELRRACPARPCSQPHREAPNLPCARLKPLENRAKWPDGSTANVLTCGASALATGVPFTG